jgi:hypothetical protein
MALRENAGAGADTNTTNNFLDGYTNRPFQQQRRFDVSQIRSRISGVSYLSKFYFRIVPSTGGKQNSKIKDILEREKLTDIFFYAAGVTVPQRAIDGENYTYSNGYRANFPTTTSYGDGTIGINVRIDEKYQNYQMFIDWMDIIHNKRTGHLSFYDEYTCDIDIYQLPYNTDGVLNDPYWTMKNFEEFEKMIEKIDRSSPGKFYKFRIKNCYPKTLSSIEYSHETLEKVTCLVNFAYEGIDYNPTLDTVKTGGVTGTIPRESVNFTSEQQAVLQNWDGDANTLAPSADGFDEFNGLPVFSAMPDMTSEFSAIPDMTPTDERILPSDSKALDQIKHISILAPLITEIASEASESLVYEDKVTFSGEGTEQSFLEASALRNMLIATQNHPSFDGSNNENLTGKYPTKEQEAPKIIVDPATGKVTNMPELLDAFHNTVGDPEYAEIMSEISYDDVRLGMQRDTIDVISSRMTNDGEEILFGSGEHSGLPTDIHDEYGETTLYNKVTSSAIAAGKHIQEKIDNGDGAASLIVSTNAINNLQNRDELIELMTMTNLTKAAQNDQVFVEERENSSTGDIGKVPNSDQIIPEIEIDPATGKVTNRGKIVEAFKRNAADPEYGPIMERMNVNDIIDDIDRDVSVLAVRNIPVPTEIRELDVYPPPKHKDISIPHAVADNNVKLELRANNLKDDNREIDTKIDSNETQINTIQSEIDTLEESLSAQSSSGNAGPISAQITQNQSLINQLQQENTSLMNKQIDNEKEIANMHDLINKGLIIQNSNLSVDDETRLHNKGERVIVQSDIQYQNKIDAIMDKELPEKVEPTLLVVLGAAELNLQHKKIYGTPEEIQAAQAEVDSLLEIEVNDGFSE